MAMLYTPSDLSDKSTKLSEDPIDFTEESPFVNLPTELWLHVFSYLKHSDLRAIRSTCKLFSDLARIPLMKKSQIYIFPERIDIISKIFGKDENLPCHTAAINNVEDNPAALKILDKVLTKQLKCLEIFESSLFQCLAEKPLPNLKKLILFVCRKNEHIEFGKWHLGLYKNLEDVRIFILSPNISDHLNLFRDILNAKFNLKTLIVKIHEKFEYLLDEIRKVYGHSGIKLKLRSLRNDYDNSMLLFFDRK